MGTRIPGFTTISTSDQGCEIVTLETNLKRKERYYENKTFVEKNTFFRPKDTGFIKRWATQQ